MYIVKLGALYLTNEDDVPTFTQHQRYALRFDTAEMADAALVRIASPRRVKLRSRS